MSDFQKQTLKRYGRNFLILCGVALLCYGGVKFELVRYAALAILALIVVGGCAWAIIRLIRWDWWLRGRFFGEPLRLWYRREPDAPAS